MCCSSVTGEKSTASGSARPRAMLRSAERYSALVHAPTHSVSSTLDFKVAKEAVCPEQVDGLIDNVHGRWIDGRRSWTSNLCAYGQK